MNCEQFELTALDLERGGAMSALERAAAVAHLNTCSRCAALQESWKTAREELRTLAEATLEAQTPAHAEARLLQEFRKQHRRVMTRRAGVAAAWALAAAAVLVGAVSWIQWQKTRNREIAKHETTIPAGPKKDSAVEFRNAAGDHSGQSGNFQATITSDDTGDDFTPLPGMLLAETDQAAILRVRMQRGTLGALGFPVSEESAGEWIQVDLMVGDDGAPQAVRLAR
jgi:hypothetical protein